MLDLKTPIKTISRILPKYQKILEKMGIFTVEDFLFHLPFRYDDFSKITPISEEHLDQAITVEGKVIKTRINRIFKRRLTVIEVVVNDENGTALKAVWFNQPFILETLKEGMSVRLSGKLLMDGKKFSMNSPAWEKSSRDMTNTGRLIPVYPETTGITSKWIRWQIKMLLPQIKNIPDILPSEIRKKYNLHDIHTTLSQLHFPDSQEKLIRAQKRMAFQEMFLVQLKALEIKKNWDEKDSLNIKFDEKLIKSFVKKLPFKLTNAQRKASFEILKDLEKPQPMNRLLNGDVGSGKTIVAAIASLEVASAGHQVALMAPTEVLARQHFESFCEIFKDYDFNITLLTNSYKITRHSGLDPKSQKILKQVQDDKRSVLLKKIQTGKINIIIGTHALIQKDVKFKNLALVIIDEQHRFGVSQRAALQNETINIDDGNNKKIIPHL